MFLRRRNSFWRQLPRRLVTGLAFVAYWAAAIGLPLPEVPAKDTSEPFPCMNHPCGCRNAEECWRHCCCLTPEQRWAWARAHHVQPPPYAEKPASWNRPGKGEKTGPAAPHACCSGHEAHDHGARPARKCCASHPTPAKPHSPPARPVVPWGVGLYALQCHGLATLWISTGAVAPVVPAPAWSPSLLPGERVADRAAHSGNPSPAPPDPPPRP